MRYGETFYLFNFVGRRRLPDDFRKGDIMNDKALVEFEGVGNSIQEIIEACLPTTMGTAKDVVASLHLAAGVIKMRQILDNPQIKEMIEALKDSPLGFITDRSPAAIENANRKQKTLKPYTWNEIRECVAEALLKGYRITNNEMNILAGRFYAAKDGKYRRIIEWPGITDFEFRNSAPAYTTEDRIGYQGRKDTVQVADVEVGATWKQDGERRTIGRIAGMEKTASDSQVFRIRAHGGDDDAVVGKALSKLFSRVLMRISGQIMPECTDIDLDGSPESSSDIIDVEQASGAGNMEIENAIADFDDKRAALGLDADKMAEFVSLAAAQNHITDAEVMVEALKDFDGFISAFKKTYPEADPKDETGNAPAEGSEIWGAFVKRWKNLAPRNFRAFYDSQKDKFETAPEWVKQETREKWARQFKGEICPIDEKDQSEASNSSDDDETIGKGATEDNVEGNRTGKDGNVDPGANTDDEELKALMETEEWQVMIELKEKYPSIFKKIAGSEVPKTLKRVNEIIDQVNAKFTVL